MPTSCSMKCLVRSSTWKQFICILTSEKNGYSADFLKAEWTVLSDLDMLVFAPCLSFYFLFFLIWIRASSWIGVRGNLCELCCVFFLLVLRPAAASFEQEIVGIRMLPTRLRKRPAEISLWMMFLLWRRTGSGKYLWIFNLTPDLWWNHIKACITFRFCSIKSWL